MKAYSPFLIPLVAFALPTFADTPPAQAPAAADKTAAATAQKAAPISFAQTAIVLAEQLLQQKSNPTDDDETQFASDSGFSDYPSLKTAFASAVSKGLEIEATGVKPGTKAFNLLLCENLGEMSVAGDQAGKAINSLAPSSPQSPDTKDPAKSDAKTQPDPNAALLAGLQGLRAASQTQVLFLAHVYRIPPPGYEKVTAQKFGGQETSLADKWNPGIELLQNGLELDKIAGLANPPKPAKAASTTATAKATSDATASAVNEYRLKIPEGTPSDQDPFPDSFTALVTAHGNALIDAATTKANQANDAATTAQQQAKTASNKASAATTGTTPPSNTTPSTGAGSGSKATPVIDPGSGQLSDTVLRNIGISFGLGVGTAVGAHSSSVLESGILRWNLIQEQATIRWNDKQSVAGFGAKRVGYGFSDIQGSKLMEDEFGYTAKTDAIENIFWRPDWYPTSFGPFFGTAVPGNYAVFGNNPNGTPIKERPYMAGIQIGWLFYDEASSLLYFDIGTTISPNSGFRYSKPYVGVSADGLVLLNLIDGIRSFVPGASNSGNSSSTKK
jgi:hypothetical protein